MNNDESNIAATQTIKRKSWENTKRTRYYINNKADLILKAAAANSCHRPGDLIEYLIIKHLSRKVENIDKLIEDTKNYNALDDALKE